MSFTSIRALELLYDEDNKREDLKRLLTQWESVLLTCVFHLRRMWRNPKDPTLLILEEEEMALRKTWLERHTEFVQTTIPFSTQTAASLTMNSRGDSSSMDIGIPLRPVQVRKLFSNASVLPGKAQPLDGTAALVAPNRVSVAKRSLPEHPVSASHPGASDVAAIPMAQPARVLTLSGASPSAGTITPVMALPVSVQLAQTLPSLTASDMLFSIICHLVLCRSRSVGKDGLSVHKALLPSIPMTNPSSKLWMDVPAFEWLAWPVLKRLRLWSLQHTKMNRQAQVWPREQELEDLEAVLAALVVCRLPDTWKSQSQGSNNMSTLSMSGQHGSPPVTQALCWTNDEQCLQTAAKWSPVELKKKNDDEEDMKKDRTAKPLDQWVGQLGMSATTLALRGAPMIGRNIIAGGQMLVGESKEAAASTNNIMDVINEEEKERKREQEIQVDQTTADEGRMWEKSLHIESFMPEVDGIFHGILIQEYFRTIAGALMKNKPVIHAGMKEAFYALLKKRSALNAGDDKWESNFRDSVFEHSLPIGARTIHRRIAVGGVSTGGSGSKYLQQARANARPTTVFQNEIGVRAAEMIDGLLDHKKQDMLEPNHELHDLFVLNFFSFVVYHETQGAVKKAANMPQAIDFMNMYYLPAYALESLGRDMLLKTKRLGMKRRPIVSWICKRWMVHDFIDVPKEQMGNVQVDMESKYEESQDVSTFSHGATTPVSAVGVWYDCNDSIEEALLLWLVLVKLNYKCELEDGTGLQAFCEKLRV